MRLRRKVHGREHQACGIAGGDAQETRDGGGVERVTFATVPLQDRL